MLRLLLLSVLLPSGLLHAGAVWTFDRDTPYEGEVRLDKGRLLVTAYGGTKTESIELDRVFKATLREEPSPSEPPLRSLPDNRIPPPFETVEIGQAAQPGSATFRDNNRFSIKSAGARLGGEQDVCLFIKRRMEGDAEISAQVTQIKDLAKVQIGLMIRASADPDAPFLALVCGDGKIQWIRRSAAGQTTQSAVADARLKLPATLRLTRRAGTLTAWVQADGQKPVGAEAFPLGPGAEFGLVVCGQDRSAPTGGYIENVRISRLAAIGDLAAPAGIKQGLMLRTGTLLAGAHILQADEDTVRFNKNERQNVAISAKSVARLVFVDLSPEAAARLPGQRRGVLLREGDFIEGDFKGVKNGRFLISSVLFGLSAFDRASQALAIVLGDVSPAQPSVVVRTADGSLFMAKSITLDKDRLIIEDELAGAFTVWHGQVVSIAAGPGRLQFLSAIKPSLVEPAMHGGIPALSIGSGVAGIPLSLDGQPVERGITLLSGARASWKLQAQYKMLNFRAAVPAGVLPSSAVRFIVLADGRELYRSAPRTSLDDALQVSKPIADVNTLTLKIEPTSDAALPIPALWADVSLVK